MGQMSIKGILDHLFINHTAEKDQLFYLLEHLDQSAKELLFSYADQTRKTVYGNKVYLRGLIEFSNYCGRNCFYCGIRRGNPNIERYRLSKKEILECCLQGNELGYNTFVLQSGEDPYYTDQLLSETVAEIKGRFPDSAVTLSVGERTFQCYKELFEAGADRYLLRHETASEKLYQQLHPEMSFQNRRKCLEQLKEIGYQVGSGFMVGLPGQTNEDLAEDLLYLKELKPHMAGIGPFIPHPETPLACFAGGTVEKTLIMLALTRLLLPAVLLPATTALGTLDPVGREKAFKAGANVVMPNLSPIQVRPKYELYKNKICTGDEAAYCRACIAQRIESSGFAVSMERGDHYD